MQDERSGRNDDPYDKPRLTPVCLPDLFRKTVERHSRRIAVLDGDKTWTYRHLDQRSDEYATALTQLGTIRGDRVGLWAARSAECLAAMLGILKCGAAYVPLDAEFPVQRVTDSLSDCDAKAIVVEASLAAQIAGFALPRIVLGIAAGGRGWTERSEGSPGGSGECSLTQGDDFAAAHSFLQSTFFWCLRCHTGFRFSQFGTFW